MKYHLPFETLFLGTLTSPSFLIFSFFMITDPATSPSGEKKQIISGFLLALIDLALHLKQSYFTFFYAALILGSAQLLFLHAKALLNQGFLIYFHQRFIQSRYFIRPLTHDCHRGFWAMDSTAK